MENKPRDTSAFGGSQTSAPASVGQAVPVTPISQPAQPLQQPVAQVAVQQPRKPSFKKLIFGISAVALLLIGGLVLLISLNVRPKSDQQIAANRFGNVEIPLSDIVATPDVELLGSRSLTVNGQLRINDALIITPSLQPSSSTAGQIYYDQTTNELNYFNGTEYVSLSGDLLVGAGISNTGGTIVNTGVLSLQGETGDVTLEAGTGITINGTTISNNGVTLLNNLSGDLTIANTTTSANTITINDASTSQKGIAQFNPTNFSALNGTINTVQDINTGASPTFASLTTTGTLTLGGLGTTDTTNALCRNSSNVLALCQATVSTAFVQDGNSFGDTATLGTNDNNGLELEVNNVVVTTISSTGATVFKNQTNSSAGFQVQDTASAGLLTVDTAARGAGGGNLIKIGNSTGTDTAQTILQLDAGTADPTSNLAALNGGMFYNSTTNKVSIIENGVVKVVCNSTDLGCSAGTLTLQNAYDNGNTISTDASGDIAFTLNGSQNFTVTTAAGGTGATTFSLADGANATPPSQLVLVRNADTNQVVAAGISVQAAGGGITTALDASGANITNALAIGAHAITGTNFSVTAGGAVTAVGVNAGAGLLQGTLGLTVSGATVSLNNDSNFATNINTGTSSGTVTIGGGSAPLVIDSTAFDVTSGGALSGITTIATSSTINSQTISAAANFTGTVTVQGANALTLGVTGTSTGAVLFKGATAASGTITLIGQANPGTRTITLPDATGTVCLTSGNCAGVGGTGDILQNGNSFTANMTIGTNDAFDLNLETTGVTRLTLESDGSQVTLASNVDLVLQGATAYISNPQASFANGEAFGLNASAGTGSNSVAIGNAASINSGGSRSIAIGRSANTNGDDSIAIGEQASATSAGGLAIGSLSRAGFDAIAIGYDSDNNFGESIAFGQLATTTASNQLVVGSNSAEIMNVFIGSGVTDTTPDGFRLQGTGGSGNNVAGANVDIAGGAGTGSANGGSLGFLVSAPGGAGSTLNGLTTVATIQGGTGAANFINISDSTQAFNIEENGGGNLFTVDTTNSRVGINLGTNNTPTLATNTQGLECRCALRLAGDDSAFRDNYTTPDAATEAAKINIVNQTLPAFGNVIALGLTSSSNASSRGIGVYDDRAGSHQPAIAVFSTDEADAFGLSWEGSTTNAYLKTLGSAISIRANTTDLATFATSGITIGNTGSNTPIALDSGTGAISIGTGAQARTINMGTGAAVQTVTIGSTNSTSSLTLDSGTGNINIGSGAQARSINIGNTVGSIQTITMGGTGNNQIVVGGNQSGGAIDIGGLMTTGTITIGGVTAQTGNLLISIGSGNQLIRIGDGGGNKTVTLGSTTGTSSLDLQAGTGTINLGATNAARTINIGTGTAVQTMNLGGTGANVIAIGNTQTGGSVSLGAAMTSGTINIGGTGAQTGTIDLGVGTGAQSINLGTGGTAAKTVTVGSTAAAGSTTIQGGTGGINIGTGGIANTIQIGTTTGAVSQTINIGNNATASSTSNTNIGSSVAGTIALTGPTTVTNRTTGAADSLVVSNSTSTGTIALFQDNTTTVFSLADAGAAQFRNQTNSATAFQIQNATGADTLLTADTAARGAGGGNLIKIGNSTGTDTNTTIFQLDAATAVPTSNLSALNGGLFYNSTTNKVSIIENGSVKVVCNTTDAGCGAGAATLQTAYDAGNTITTTDGRNIVINLADTATDANFAIDLQCDTACGSDGRFAIQEDAVDVFTISPSTGIANFINKSNNASAFNIENASGDNLLTVSTANSRVGINLGSNNTPVLTGSGLELNGALRMSGTENDTFTTPDGANVGARINIASMTVGGAAQILAMGLTSSSDATARGILVADDRAGGHQPSIAVLSPNENQIGGFTWDGDNAVFKVTNSNGSGGFKIEIGGAAFGDFDAVSGTTIGNTAANLAVAIVSGTGAINIGTLGQARTVNVGTGAAAQTVNIGSTNSTSSLTLDAGTGTVAIANSASARTINMATGAAVQTITVGSTNSTSALTLQAGTGNLKIQTQGGTLGIGDNAVAQTIAIGNTTGATAITLNAGTGNITIGASNTTGTLLILDTDTDSTETTGADGAMYYSSHFVGMRCYFDAMWRFCNEGLSMSWMVDMREDFIGGDDNTGGCNYGEQNWCTLESGTGSLVDNVGPDVASRPGQMQFSTGTTTTGWANMFLNGGEPIMIAGGEEIEFAVNIANLADGTNDYDMRIGLCDTTNADCVDGVYFEYDRDSSTNWRYATANASTRTKTSSSTAVATGWTRFKIVVNSAANSITFYVNGTSLGTAITTNIPTANTTEPGFTIQKEAGTTNRQMRIDYFQMRNRFTTAR